MRTKRKEKRTTTLKVDQIHRDADTQARVSEDLDYIEELKLLVLGGHDLPAIDVTSDGTHYWCSDGHQRLEAYLRAGRETIECNVRPGTKADAVWAACAANQSHGLRRTNADKERAVRLALSHQKAAGMSDRDIARHCGVSQPMVSKYRRDESAPDKDYHAPSPKSRKPASNPAPKHATTAFIPDPENEQPADGDVPWEADPQYEEPVYEDRAGPEEPVGEGPEGEGPAWEDQANNELAEAAGEDEGPELEPVGEPATDAGQPKDCPFDAGDTPVAAKEAQTAGGQRLEPADEATRKELLQMQRSLAAMRTRLEAMANTRAGTFLEWLQVRKSLDEAHHAVKFAAPYAVCPYCGGRGRNCEPCRGVGWVNETIYRTGNKAKQVA